ncbi:MAG: TonB-dependent receptor [Candidatus Omnitrophota bacterium]|jgi:outer membrane cobalamin receptor
MIPRIKNVILTALVFLSFYGISKSQDLSLEKIVVTPSRTEEPSGNTPQNVDMITSEDIEKTASGDLSELLTQFTAVNISNYGGPGATKNIRMRGSSAAQTLVMVDGKPINSPRNGEADLSMIPLDTVDKIEIVHGPVSHLYGSSAMGGAINIITKDPPRKSPKTELYSSIGSLRTYTQRLTNGNANSQFGYLFTHGYTHSDGFRANALFNAQDYNMKLKYTPHEAHAIIFNSGFYSSNLGSPGSLSQPDSDDKQNSRKNSQDLTWKYTPDESAGLSFKSYHSYDKLIFSEFTAGSFFDTANKKDIHTTNVTGFDIQGNKKLFQDRYHFICGFNYIGNTNDSTNSQKNNYHVVAGYLENKFTALENLEFNLGARFDDYSNFGTQSNPNFSFLYRFNPVLKFHGLISRSFRAPTFNDLYWPDEGWAKGNPGLKPEKGITKEIGTTLSINDFLTTRLTYFRNDFKDLINWAEDAGVWMPDNVGSALIDGIEFENKISLAKNIQFNTGYTFLRAIDDQTNKYLIYQPKHKADCSLAYADLHGFSIKINAQFTDKRYHDAANTVKVKRFYSIGIHASKRFNPYFTYYFSIDNLLNKKYEVIREFPMPGFAITNGVKIEF